ncbi:hypothetical protein REPUB_Repub17cG0006800 [Reevesia pubescens]
MYFFLPDAIDGLQKLLQMFKLNPEYFNQRFELHLENISDFWIPRFKFSFEFEASDAMKELGLNLSFDNKNAEITEMVDSPWGLYVEKMFHKSFIEVNEEGTEAVACTVCITKPLCLRYPIPSFSRPSIHKNAAKGSNTVISPFSFHLLLSLIAVGSRGRTLEQLFHCLGLKSLEDLNSLSSQMISLASPANESNSFARGDPQLSFVNGAWIREGLNLKPSFREILEGVYNAIAKEVDFVNKAEEVVAEVNAWAETATRGLIKNLLTAEALESLNEKTALILANAVYFKGTWAQLFDTSQTENRVFHLLNGQTVRVPFMTSLEFERYLYGSFDGYKILKLPYKSSQTSRKFAMYFFLPDAIDGLKNLLQMFKSNPEYINKRFDLVKEKISDFWIPRFKFSFEFEASEAMIELGLHLPFDEILAQITEMVNSPYGLFVKKMFHKSFVEVNEEGTKAAASTAAIMQMQCQRLRHPSPSFVADHPFMFMIKEETTGVVFFVGTVLNPILES